MFCHFYNVCNSCGQAQQLFQRDAQTITPEALENVKAALASSEYEHKAEAKKKAVPRKAAGQSWEDPTLAEWPESKLNFLFILLFLAGCALCCSSIFIILVFYWFTMVLCPFIVVEFLGIN